MAGDFRSRFWQPPRAHGEVVPDRTVSFLELFYDLVYVVVIARAAHTLAHHITWRGVGEFAVVFSLIWIGWQNGSLYYELHGREDGRTRTLVFGQMVLLALLAVYTSDAAGDTGTEFAIVYAVFFALLTAFWYTIYRADEPEFAEITRRYLTAMVSSTVVMAGSAFLDPDIRMLVWAGFVVIYVIGSIYISKTSGDALQRGMPVTDSMVERFGLFTIIVLGEVVVGVVDGISNSDLTPITVATGILGLMIGFAFWWSYFDFVGRRLPDASPTNITNWMMLHLPLTMSIAATGAAMVSLVEHASDDHAPAPAAWLMGAGIALGLITLVMVMTTLVNWERFPTIYQPTAWSLVLAAGLSLLVGWWQPVPWLMLLLLVLVLSATWFNSAIRWAHLDDPESALPGH